MAAVWMLFLLAACEASPGGEVSFSLTPETKSPTAAASPTAEMHVSLASIPISSTPTPFASPAPSPTLEPYIPPTATATPVPPALHSFAAIYTGTLTIYRHPTRLFELDLPAGWQFTEATNGVSVSHPDQPWYFSIYLIPNNLQGPASQAALIESYENHLRLLYPGYDHPATSQEEQYTLVTKQVMRDEQPAVLQTCYFTETGWLYMLDLGWSGPLNRSPEVSCAKLIEWTGFHPLAETGITWWPFTSPKPGYKELFFINVPLYWDRQVMEGDSTFTTRFISPGGLSHIELYSFTSTAFWEDLSAGDYVVDYLANTYGPGVQILGTLRKRDQRVFLDWRAAPQSTQGFTFYEIRGTTLLINTFTSVDSSWEFFYPVFDFIRSSCRRE